MKILKNVILLVVSLVIGNTMETYSQTIQSGPPEPPVGKRWVINPDFSDEFNGTELDTAKWYDHHPKWIGRVPGLFLPSQVSVSGGYLQIRGEKMKKDTVINAYGKTLTYNIAGGAVVSKNSTFLGYYECRVKAAATTMSTTFWFSTDGSKEGPKGCDSYGLEWDIHESVGRNGDFEGSYFANGMHSNSHFWYTDCEGEKHDYRSSQVLFNNPEVSSKDFHVYGGWWRDTQTASYYYDDRDPKHQKFYDKISDKPFDRPMYMRLVCETYPFPWIELPTDEELADTTKNVVYYDWVRGYELVDVFEAVPIQKDAEIVKIFDENINFPQAEIEVASGDKLTIPLTYKAVTDREIKLILTDSTGEKVSETTFTAYAGYANLKFVLDQLLKVGDHYTLTGQLFATNDKNDENIDVSTLNIMVVNQLLE
ncbi:MAG: beta-porphyranase D [Lutimonas sp.]